MRKLFALLLALTMITTAGLGAAEQPLETPEAEKEIQVELPEKLVVGSTTKLSGSFFTSMWGNNTADIDVRAMIHGYNTVAAADALTYIVNPTVAQVTMEVLLNGNHEYVFTVAENLRYSDGTQITAKDYVFSILLAASPQIAQLGGEEGAAGAIVGYADYHEGRSGALSGVRLLSDYQFAITISADFLPFFYELSLISYNPYPIQVLAPGCEVADDGQGAYIRNEGDQQAEPLFTAELLEKTIFDPNTGYMTHPAVTSGPYVLTGYDSEAGTASFTMNPLYAGDHTGQKPTIETVEFKLVSGDTMMAELENGTVNLLNKVTSGEAINQGMQLLEGGTVSMSNYLRTGFSFISFSCEQGPTQFEAVRKAIRYCLDVENFVPTFLQNYGQAVYGYYGMGQWMVQLINGLQGGTIEWTEEPDTETEKRLAALTLENIPKYAYDLDEAKALLEADGWTLNKEGQPFVEGTDTLRCKMVGDQLMPLEIKWAKSAGNKAADLIQQMLALPMETVGMKLTVTEMDFTEMLKHYYRETDREYDMFYLAFNFADVFDPTYVFSMDESHQGSQNVTGIKDEKLARLASDLTRTESGDTVTYLEKWVAFQEYWAQVLPAIPLYSNVYFDFYTVYLQNYAPHTNVSWGNAVPYAYFGVPVEEEPVTGLPGDGLVNESQGGNGSGIVDIGD